MTYQGSWEFGGQPGEPSQTWPFCLLVRRTADSLASGRTHGRPKPEAHPSLTFSLPINSGIVTSACVLLLQNFKTPSQHTACPALLDCILLMHAKRKDQRGVNHPPVSTHGSGYILERTIGENEGTFTIIYIQLGRAMSFKGQTCVGMQFPLVL